MSFSLRSFTISDYDAMSAITTVIYRENGFTVEELRKVDSLREPKILFERWVAEIEGQVVSFAEYTQRAHKYHLQKFFIDGYVHPAYQRQGIGTALYNCLLESLQSYDPLFVRAATRESQPQSIHFLEARGFQEDQRKWESRLDLSTFDPTPYIGLVEKLRGQGIEIQTLRELSHDPERNQKLYHLDWELRQDVPTPEPRNPISYEQFYAQFIDDPHITPDAYFVAVEHDRYVGLSNLELEASDEMIAIGLTGSLRSHRHRGIATALKLRGILYAKTHGYKTLRTMNDASNMPILALNKRLGFVKYPQSTLISYFKRLMPEDA